MRQTHGELSHLGGLPAQSPYGPHGPVIYAPEISQQPKRSIWKLVVLIVLAFFVLAELFIPNGYGLKPSEIVGGIASNFYSEVMESTAASRAASESQVAAALAAVEVDKEKQLSLIEVEKQRALAPVQMALQQNQAKLDAAKETQVAAIQADISAAAAIRTTVAQQCGKLLADASESKASGMGRLASMFGMGAEYDAFAVAPRRAEYERCMQQLGVVSNTAPIPSEAYGLRN